MALNTFWESGPCRGSRDKDRKFRAELARLIQSTDCGTDDIIGFEILHVVNRRIDKHAATASCAESTIDSCAAICDHLVALGGTTAQFECASRSTNHENLVSASEVLAVSTITEILPCRLGGEFVDYFPAPTPS